MISLLRLFLALFLSDGTPVSVYWGVVLRKGNGFHLMFLFVLADVCKRLGLQWCGEIWAFLSSVISSIVSLSAFIMFFSCGSFWFLLYPWTSPVWISAASEDNIRSKQCVNLSIEDMDNKENLYTASSNRYGLAAVPQAMPQTGMAKKAGHRNLRKSLAWNKAFFTEEGLLLPLGSVRPSVCICVSNVVMLLTRCSGSIGVIHSVRLCDKIKC